MKIQQVQIFSRYQGRQTFGSEKSRYDFMLAKQVNYKKNPQEHEYNKLLGNQIQKAKADIEEYEAAMQNTTSLEEQKKLMALKKQLEDKQSVWIQELVERNLGFALQAAKDHTYLGAQFDDLVSSASIGIMEAAKNYDPSQGAHFITYARYWAGQQIKRDCAGDSQVTIPIQAQIDRKRIDKAKLELENKLNREPSYQEIAQYLDMSELSVKMNLLSTNITQVSLNADISANEEGDSFANIIADPQSSSALEKQMREEERSCLRKLMPKYLTERERLILNLRYRLNEDDNSEECIPLDVISQKVGLTKERIRQIEIGAIAKLRKIAKGPDVDLQKKQQLNEVQPQTATQQHPLEKILLLNKFINALTEGESPKVKEQLISKLKMYSPDDFVKILETATRERRTEVLKLRFFKNHGLSYKEIAPKLEILAKVVKYHEEAGLKDIKQFLLEGDSISYSFLKKAISEKLQGQVQKNRLKQRVEQTSPEELEIIMKSILSENERLYLKEKYGIGKDLRYGWQPKENEELAQILNVRKKQAHATTCRGLHKLKEYFSKATRKNTNVSRFAQIASSYITDEAAQEKAEKELGHLTKADLDTLLNKLLTQREFILLMNRYHLDKPDAPKTRLKTKEELTNLFPGVTTDSGISHIEHYSFAKIKRYYESGVISNREMLANDIIKDISDSKQKNEIKDKIISFSDEEFTEKLNTVLTEKDKDILMQRYSLNAEYSPEQKLISREKIRKNFSCSQNTLRLKEAKIIDRLKTFFTVGLPSNIDLLAQEISQKAENTTLRNKISEIIKSQDIKQINKIMETTLSETEQKILSEFFNLNSFQPIFKDNFNITDLAQKTKIHTDTIYRLKVKAIKKLYDFYKQGLITNIDFLADEIIKHITREELRISAKDKFYKYSHEKLLEVMDTILTPQEKKVLQLRYDVNSVINEFEKQITLREIAQNEGMTTTSIWTLENNAMKKLAEYFKS